MSKCDRCITEKALHYHEASDRHYCIFCLEYIDLQTAYVKLQDHTMTDEDILLLDDVRATCHGGGAAVALALKGEGQLNLEGMQEMLREGSKKLVEVTDHYGGWPRIARLRGIK